MRFSSFISFKGNRKGKGNVKYFFKTHSTERERERGKMSEYIKEKKLGNMKVEEEGLSSSKEVYFYRE